MTLAELLALLPDNTTGDIGADDMRTIVTDLYNAAYATTDADAIAAHLIDTTDAHDASAVSIADAGNLYVGTTVEAALQELKTIAAGLGLTATTVGDTTTLAVESLLMAKAQALFARATADVTRTATAALADDPQLVLTLAANAVYEIRLRLFYDGPGSGAAGADFRVGFTQPAGAAWTWTWGILAAQSALTVATATQLLRNAYDGWAANPVIGAVNPGVKMAADVTGILVTDATGGAFTFQWAQGVSDPGNTIRLANSALIAERVA